MNKERRNKIAVIAGQVADLASELEDLLDEEQGYLDAMPEAFAEGEKGEKSQAWIDKITEAHDNLRAVENELDYMD